MSGRTFRIAHDNDPVPSVPPKLFWDFGYYHVPREIWYPGNNLNNEVVCDNSGEDSDCHSGFDFSWSLFSEFLDDHLHYLGFSTDCD